VLDEQLLEVDDYYGNEMVSMLVLGSGRGVDAMPCMPCVPL